MSRATYEAGFGSSSRVYERTDALLGMTPASYRRGGLGVRIRYAIADAPIGRVLVGTTDRGVCAVELGATNADVEQALRADFPNATIERSDDAQVGVGARGARAHSRSAPRSADTTFRSTWTAPRSSGSSGRRCRRSRAASEERYREVARAIGRPTATRAVARACATNRVAIVIPCHRVVREDGDLAGYKWGVDRKRKLLDEEAG